MSSPVHEFTANETVSAVSAIPKVLIEALADEPVVLDAALRLASGLDVQIGQVAADAATATAAAVAAAASAAEAAGNAGAALQSNVAIDVDGRPYFDTAGVSASIAVPILLDVDGRPYLSTA